MARISEYPPITTLDDDQLLIVDKASTGTKIITAKNAANEFGKKWSGKASFDDAINNSTAMTDYEDSVNTELESLKSLYNSMFPKVDANGATVEIQNAAESFPIHAEVAIEPVQEGSGTPSTSNYRRIVTPDTIDITKNSEKVLEIDLSKILLNKNLLPSTFSSGDSRTANGLTFTVHKTDGKIDYINVNGTCTATTLFYFSNWGDHKFDMKKYAGMKLMLGKCVSFLDESKCYFEVMYRKVVDESAITLTRASTKDAEFTVPAEEDLADWSIFMAVMPGAVMNNYGVRPMVYFAGAETKYDSTYVPPITGDYINYANSPYAKTGGGKLTVYEDGRAKLIIDRRIISYSGDSDSWYKLRDNVVAVSVPFDIAYPNSQPNPPTICSHFRLCTEGGWGYMTAGTFLCADKVVGFYFNTVDALKSYFQAQYAAGTPVQVVFALPEPIEIDLGYAMTEQILTTFGKNTIASNAGDIAITYHADPVEYYINGRFNKSKAMIAGVETEMKASQNYSTGDLLIVGDDLYKATKAITIDESIVEGTNVAKTTVAEQILALK